MRGPLAIALLASVGSCAGDPAPSASPSSAPATPSQGPTSFDSFSLTLTITPVASGSDARSPTLRSLDLHVAADLREPHGTWPDGTPISADARITADEARAITQVLDRHGFFTSARRHYSERRPSPRMPPPASAERGLPPPDPAPHVRLNLAGAADGDWHLYLIRDWPLGAEIRALLMDVRGSLSAGRDELDRIIVQL